MANRIMGGFNLLMVDDSPDDIFFVQRAVEKSGVGHSFQAVTHVEEAIDYLRGIGQYADRKKFPFPNALLADIKMPGLSGFDLLKWLQDHPECKVIPTIAFSSSAAESDIHRVYVLGGNAFLIKPTDLNDIIELIQVMYAFWSRCQTPMPPPGEKCA